MKQTLCVLALLCYAGILIGQGPKLKWGKVSKAEWAMETCPFDSTAEAVVLFDKAKITFRGSEAVIFRHKRIKILDEKALEYANVEIPFYRYRNLEKVQSLKVQTLIKNENGKVEEIELKNTQEFANNIDDYWGTVRFSCPAVKKGAIIEYKYEFITGNIYFLEPWYFQNELPTWHSQLGAEIPEALNYNAIKIGKRIQEAYPTETDSEWVLKELPGFKYDDFVYQPLDYADQVRFQLNSYWKSSSQVVGGTSNMVRVLKDWKTLGNDMLDGYIGFTRKKRQIQEYIEQKQLDVPKDHLGLKVVLEHVQNNFQWNNYNSIYLQKSLKDFLESQKGNAAELNLFLYALLDALGFEVKPILISTRPHGKLVNNFPLLSQFNRIVNKVKIEDQYFYMDVIPDPIHHPYYILPNNDLNFYGLQLEKDNTEVIEMKDWPSSSKGITLKVDLKDSIFLSTQYQGYYAMKELSQQKPSFDSKEWNLFGGNALFKFENGKDETAIEGGKLSLNFSAPFVKEENSDLLYFSVADFSNYSNNPFKKKDNRSIPIEMEFPFSENIQLLIKKDDAYLVEELPESLILALPGKAGRFNYSVKDIGDQYMILTTIRLKEVLMSAEAYPYLYEFFKRIEDKLGEPLIFKKKG